VNNGSATSPNRFRAKSYSAGQGKRPFFVQHLWDCSKHPPDQNTLLQEVSTSDARCAGRG
jgi:hypothetical protein